VVAVEEGTPQERKNQQEETPSLRKEDVASTSLERKQRWYTVRLFGTNSLKEGAM
jgi:hypothetical protein